MVCLERPVAIILLLLFVFLLPVMAGGLSYSVPVSVAVNPIYALSLEVRVLNDEVQAGKNLQVSLRLRKGERRETIEVGLDYEILRGEETVSSGHLGSVILRYYMGKSVRIPVPDWMEPGEYTLRVTASNPQAYPGSGTDDFWVRGKCAWWQFWCWWH